ncbi:MAG: hypothetical protein ACK40L_17035 [Hydrogenophaga sp.]|jgi:hypothetical protein|nr:hypothetical protein [Hydrogenophaga sp.]
MTPLKLTSILAVLAMATSATSVISATGAQTPDQRALALALSLADEAASQKPKSASVTTSGQTAPAALTARVTNATGSKK